VPSQPCPCPRWLSHPKADRGKRRLTVDAKVQSRGDDVVLIDAGGYAAGVISAPDGKLAVGSASPKSRSVSNKTSQAGDA
jgi:osmoprotectant transport system ATP-binding protein